MTSLQAILKQSKAWKERAKRAESGGRMVTADKLRLLAGGLDAAVRRIEDDWHDGVDPETAGETEGEGGAKTWPYAELWRITHSAPSGRLRWLWDKETQTRELQMQYWTSAGGSEWRAVPTVTE